MLNLFIYRTSTLFPFLALSILIPSMAMAEKLSFYIGTYTKDPKSGGIWISQLDSVTGAFSETVLAVATSNPSFLTFSPDQQFIFSVEENSEGGVASFQRLKSGKLKLISRQPSAGAHPCHVEVDRSGKTLFAANYSSGNIVSFPIQKEGVLGVIHQNIDLKSLYPERKLDGKSNAHGNYIDSKNRFLYACDLGMDSVAAFSFDSKTECLTPLPPHGQVTLGGGPRHLAFHPSEKYLYVNHEYGMAVSVFERDLKTGSLSASPLQTISTLPLDTEMKNFSTAEILCHPSGKFLYVSNRGHHSITVFSIESSGKLTWVENTPSIGKTPRGMAFDPSGHWLVVGGQENHRITSLKIDLSTGKLQPTGHFASVESPVCIIFSKEIGSALK